MSESNALYRPCVGIALFNAQGRVFVGERIDTPGSWQMPQGGIDAGEDLIPAALRELKEEIGTDKASLIKIHDKKIKYEIPAKTLKGLHLQWDKPYIGQEQTWIAMRFDGDDNDIQLDADDHPEFSQWQWVRLEETIDLIVPFKRETYRQIIDAFKNISH